MNQNKIIRPQHHQKYFPKRLHKPNKTLNFAPLLGPIAQLVRAPDS